MSLSRKEGLLARAPDATASGQGATQSLAEWQEQRAGLETALVCLAETAEARGDAEEARSRREAAGRLAEGRLTLAILGEFKRGKSTLINSLLGAEVMPVGVIPMTSVPLLVEYGMEASVTVELSTGELRGVDPAALGDYATETGNPGNRKGVARIQIQHPARILQTGVILVDTPGIGSIHAHNTRAAYEILNQADAAIFVLSVDSPASRAELDFLAAARGQVSRLIFALNKADLLSSEELQQSIAFVRSILAEVGPGQEAMVFPISARLRDEGFQEMEAALERFLLQERGHFLVERARDVAVRALQRERQAAQLERAALSLSAQEVDRRIALLNQRLQEVSRQRVEVEEVLAGDMRRLISTTLDPSIGGFRERGEASVKVAVEEEIDRGREDLRDRLDARIAMVIVAEVGSFMQELEAELGTILQEVADRHAARTNALIAQAVRATSEVFEVNLEEMALLTELRPRSQRLLLTRDEELALERISSALKGLAPGGLGISLARRDALRRGEELVDRHCGRIRHDVVERLQAREREWRQELGAALASLETTVRQAAAVATRARAAGAGEQQALLLELDRRERRLSEVEAANPAPDRS